MTKRGRKQIPHLCSECGETDEGQFYKGRKSICRPCELLRGRGGRVELLKRGRKPGEPRPSRVKSCACRECGETSPAEFYRGNKSLCSSCNNNRAVESARGRRERAPAQAMIKSARQRARARGLEFDLSADWLTTRYTGRCEVTGVPLVRSDGGNGWPYSPSLDRIDSSKGYTRDNTRIVCWGFNMLRGDRDDDSAVFEFVRELAAAPLPGPAEFFQATRPPGDECTCQSP